MKTLKPADDDKIEKITKLGVGAIKETIIELDLDDEDANQIIIHSGEFVNHIKNGVKHTLKIYSASSKTTSKQFGWANS